jgi:apolipoprotein D and lipocalin family protein
MGASWWYDNRLVNVVFEIDQEGYEYAFVSGPDTSYLWLLSRTPQLQQEIIEKFKRISKELGFDTSKLIFVNQDENA